MRGRDIRMYRRAYRHHYPDYQSIATYKDVQENSISEDNQIDWASLLEQNSDTVAWVWIPDTIVNYPVVQTDNNDYYLDHDFTQTYNKFGNVFLDADFSLDADPKMQNSVVYGLLEHLRQPDRL